MLGKLPVPGHLSNGAGEGGDSFSFIYHFSLLSPFTVRQPDMDWNTVSKGR